MQKLLLTIFEEFEQKNIQYCLMRDHDELAQMASGEIDLLVRHDHFRHLEAVLHRLGFLKLPGWGYAPHHFFLTYDKHSDSWLKLDVVTEVTYGRPIPALHTSLASRCLQRRRRSGPAYVPSPEDELLTLLLHCILDKRYFAPTRCKRLQALCHQVTEEQYLTGLLASVGWSTMTWFRLATLIHTENWPALLADGQKVASYLASRDKLGTLGRQVRKRLFRKFSYWIKGGYPGSLMVALLAPDGAGKSTLAAGIQNSFYFPVRSIYMGLYQQNANHLAWLNWPGLSFAGRLLTQWARYLRARYHQARGRLVIFDRYTYDAWLSAPQRQSWPRRLRRWLLAHACPAPDLVLLLDMPGELLYARKGEHNPTFLEQQRHSYLKLQPYLPQMVVIDAAQEADQVRRETISLIWRGYLERQARSKAGQLMRLATAEESASV